MTVSARNKLAGNIVEIIRGSVMAHLTIQVGEILIESVITMRSVEEMGLEVGDRVVALVKSTEIMVQKG
jgi:molybdopterin-binding protein